MRLAVIGSGPGGYVAAIKAAQLGASVTVIEDSEVGGPCLNRGCIPTKSLVASAEMLSKSKELDKFGIILRGEIHPDIAAIMNRKDRIVGIQVKGIKALFKSWGVTLREGRGVLTSPASIEVALKDGSSEKIETDCVIIATGSRPAGMAAFPFDGEKILSSTDALEFNSVPASLLIIGAGVIGCEFASIYRELGSEVTMIEMMDRAVATEDHEASELLEREFKKKKIKLLKGVSVGSIKVKEDGVHAFLSDGIELVAEKMLVSIGRTLNSDNLGLETLGIDTGKKGEIIVDSRMETNVPGIYAVGDVTGKLMLAHVASRQGLVAAKNIMGIPDSMEYDVVPSAIFTMPEMASVGLREHQAVEKGVKIRTGHFQFRTLARAHAMGEITGFFKIISDFETDKILGAHIAGAHASDIIHEIAVAMNAGLTTRDIAETIHAHPTLSEGVMETAEDLHGEAVHVQKKPS